MSGFLLNPEVTPVLREVRTIENTRVSFLMCLTHQPEQENLEKKEAHSVEWN